MDAHACWCICLFSVRIKVLYNKSINVKLHMIKLHPLTPTPSTTYGLSPKNLVRLPNLFGVPSHPGPDARDPKQKPDLRPLVQWWHAGAKSKNSKHFCGAPRCVCAYASAPVMLGQSTLGRACVYASAHACLDHQHSVSARTGGQRLIIHFVAYIYR